MVTDAHSFTVIDVDAKRLQLRQIDESGHEVDRMVITQAGVSWRPAAAWPAAAVDRLEVGATRFSVLIGDDRLAGGSRIT